MRFGKTVLLGESDSIAPMLVPLLRRDLTRQGPTLTLTLCLTLTLTLTLTLARTLALTLTLTLTLT